MHATGSAASIENLKSKIENDGVLTLADLDGWSHPGPALAVLGHPIKHSVSPAMHNAALAAMAAHDARFAPWKYFRFDMPPAQLPAALAQLHAAGFLGLNLTVPHKVLAVGLVAEIDPAARAIGAVNTLRRTATGWKGFNTDGYGLATALKTDLALDLAGAHVVLLGAGGAARGAAVECLQRRCASLRIGNRTRANLDTLLAALRPLAGDTVLEGFDPTEPPAAMPAGVVVVNATSAGLQPGEPAPMDLRRLPPGAKVYDMVYNPPQTSLLRDAATLGLPHANGLSMLVHQGARALEIWTGAAVPAAVMDLAARTALGLRA
ncbi:shikimate dehydrogenase [Oleiharenicola lentus]|uniref:shikimate dehydrogenase n=1 Tax=Oleiharenicola lentus TaxID=2508720 RepID=UPI0015D1882E|nr:shikimate dehydrogenase [Oleiharenicola lentus]